MKLEQAKPKKKSPNYEGINKLVLMAATLHRTGIRQTVKKM